MRRPNGLKFIPLDDWYAMTEEEQKSKCEAKGIQTSETIRTALATPPARMPVITAPVHAIPRTSTPSQARSETSTASATTILPRITDIRQWNEDIDGVSAERLRNCIVYQLDVRKREYWIKNMVPAVIRMKAHELDDETPPGWAPPEANPLIVEKTLPDGETKITVITRELATDAERKIVRDRYGVTSYTIPKLAKKDCAKCKGTGYYNLPTYPDHPVYKKYEDTVTCECVSE
jgi:hypothetical protein